MVEASQWVQRFIGGVPKGGEVLDVACGGGRHIGLCRANGRRVTGIDRDIGATKAVHGGDAGVTLLQRDLEDGGPLPFPPGSFDGVIVTNYLWRPILTDIVEAVSPGGLLLYETFRVGHERYGKPSRPDFLLRPGELLAAVSGTLHVVAYEEATIADPPRVVQRICAVGRDHPWVGQPPDARKIGPPNKGRPA